jgi:hypothetical protein
MRVSGFYSVLLTAMAGVVGCTANIHDNTINIPNATINATTDADVSAVAPEQTIPMTVTVTNVYLVDPAMTPPPAHTADAGHLQVYLDDTSSAPILVTADTNIMVTVPKETPAGHHKIICRVHTHDGTPTSTTFELAITVKVTVTTGSDGAVTVDATVTVEVGAMTSDAATSETN